MLAKKYRITVLNETTQTIAVAGVVVKRTGKKFDSSGVLTFEASETTVLSSSGTLANGAYLSSAAQDNSSDGFIEADFTVTIVAPASSTAQVTVYYEPSTDGTTFATNGRGTKMRTIATPSAGTYTEVFTVQ